MNSEQNKRELKLSLVGLEPPLSLAQFSNDCGNLATATHLTGHHEGIILDEENKTLWAGIVDIEPDGRFYLCISPKANESNEILRWKDLPPFFTIFDGGYDALTSESVGLLLDDLITFHNLVHARGHFLKANGQSVSVKCKWEDQENLKELSEIFIGWESKQELQPQQILLLELELFETVYFVIGIVEENFPDGAVLSLTSHFYQQRNRVGRRIPIEPTNIDGYVIEEVSDFGIKVIANRTSALTDTISIKINDYSLPFKVVYTHPINENQIQIGGHIIDHSPPARKAWQSFLLKHQYPLLSYRNQSKHLDILKLLDKSGYFADAVGNVVRTAVDDILQEWRNIDEIGPELGITAIGIDTETNEAIATIGISRVSKHCWTAQTAAVLDSPKYLNHTQSMYSWRTRAILQQIDGGYHLAFFDADKPFLDRFFRKFYLLNTTHFPNSITWNEWYAHYLLNPPSSAETYPKFNYTNDNQINTPQIQVNNLAKVLIADSCELVQKSNTGHVFNGRRHLHIAQLFASIWNEHNNNGEYLTHSKKLFAAGHKFILLMNSEDFDNSVSDTSYGIKYNKKVTWTCERKLLPRFLANSLKALEIMQRKYGRKNTA